MSHGTGPELRLSWSPIGNVSGGWGAEVGTLTRSRLSVLFRNNSSGSLGWLERLSDTTLGRMALWTLSQNTTSATILFV